MKNETDVKGSAVYVIDGARTPFLKSRGIPGPFSAADLAVNAAKPLLDRQNFSPSVFNEVIVGCASPSEEEANIARIIALRLGCGDNVPGFTVQRNCASGLQAVDSAFQKMINGTSDLVLVGGTEAMSRIPLLYNQKMVVWLAKLNQAKGFPKKINQLIKFRPGFLTPVIAILKGLTDPVVNFSMGQTAEELAYLFSISREEMDSYSVQSHQRVIEAQAKGNFQEIVPLFAQDGMVYEQDDGVRADSDIEKLKKLKPVFDKYGNITAGNSSQVSDGAAFLILASERAVERHQLKPLAKIKNVQWAGLDPRIMGLGPVHAIAKILLENKLSINDIEHLEINEAFAAQVLGCIKAWEEPEYSRKILGLEAVSPIDLSRLNPHGGAIAMGHPVGASGARLVLHCAKMMEKYQHHYAMASLCIGGGQGGAILLERV